MLTEHHKDRLFEDSQYKDYFQGQDFLDAQPSSLVPDDWYQDWDRWMTKEVRRALFDLHVAFLESLFDAGGFTTLYRAMEKSPKVRPGDVVNLGQFWTYSGDADLSHAQVASGADYKTGFAARVHESQVDWPQTIADHTRRWDDEKQFYVRGPVEVVDVFPIAQWPKRTEKKSFSRWARTRFTSPR